MTLLNAAGILCTTALLVVVVSGHSYGSDVYGYIESRLLGSDMFYENAAATAGSCETKTYENQCLTAEFDSDYPVHVCQKDDLNGLCYYSDVPTCCKKATSLFKCKSVTNVKVGGETTSVTHYQRELSGEICVSFSPDVDACHGDCKKSKCANVGCPSNLVCDSNGANCVCKEGFTKESECCDCDKDHYLKVSEEGTIVKRECKKYCRGNCESGMVGPDGQVIGPCLTCLRGYAPPDCCKCPPGLVEKDGECKSGCDKDNTLYFFIDATSSNKFENFCPLIVTMQMLVAAFNPSATSKTQIGAILFPDKTRKRVPSSVFSVGTSCRDAIQGEKNSLLSLVLEYGTCLDKKRKYSSSKYPSMCGEGTSAVAGLKEIYKVISSERSSYDGVVLMLTDGEIRETDDKEREDVLQKFKDAEISIIAAGIGDANLESMKRYSSNTLIDSDAVKLSIAIVNKLASMNVLCKKEADDIVRILGAAGGTSIKNFCTCHRSENAGVFSCVGKKYPTCSGDLSSRLLNYPLQLNLKDSLVSMEEEGLEEEIVAAVEDVLERFNGSE